MFKVFLIVSLSCLLLVSAQFDVEVDLDIDRLEELTLDEIIQGLTIDGQPVTFEELENARNIFVTLLPLYGGAKLIKLITQKNFNDIKAVFVKSPHLWQQLVDEFATCDVWLPTLEKSNWTLEKSDFDRIYDILGRDATLASFFDDDYVDALYEVLDDHDTVVFLLYLAARFGVVIGHDADLDTFGQVAGDALLDGPIILALLPTLTSMLILAMIGKRDVAVEKLSFSQLFQLVQGLLSHVPTQYLNLVASVLGNLGVVLPHTKSILESLTTYIVSFVIPVINNLIQG